MTYRIVSHFHTCAGVDINAIQDYILENIRKWPLANKLTLNMVET